MCSSDLNLIGQGAIGRGASLDDIQIDALAKAAIESDIQQAFLGSAADTDKLLVKIGEKTYATLIGEDRWAIEFINDGLFLNSSTTLGAEPLSVGTNSGIDEVEFTNYLDHRLLESINTKEGSLNNSSLNSPAPSVSSVYSRDISRAGSRLEIRLSDTGTRHELDLGVESQPLDFMPGYDTNMIPDFGMGYSDLSILGEEEPFVYEYWIEQISL